MDQNSIRKYLDGVCTQEEAAAVERYLADDQSDFSALQGALQQRWEDLSEPGPGDPVLKRVLKDELYAQLFEEAQSQQASVITMLSSKRKIKWFRIVAAVLLPVIAGMITWQYFFPGEMETAIPVTAWKILKNTGVGQQMALLPDGTRVWLNPGTELSYTAEFINNQRGIQLKGEAFFDVAQDAAHPFVVHAGLLSTQVLGTAFNIEAYPTESNVRISLVSGKVSVAAEDIHSTAGQAGSNQVAVCKPTIITAGQMFDYDATSGQHRIAELKMKQQQDWTSGNIVFSNVPLQDALQRIAARYKLTLKYSKGVDLGNKRFTSVFRKETPEEMLQLMLFISDYHFQIKGNIVEILP